MCALGWISEGARAARAPHAQGGSRREGIARSATEPAAGWKAADAAGGGMQRGCNRGGKARYVSRHSTDTYFIATFGDPIGAPKGRGAPQGIRGCPLRGRERIQAWVMGGCGA